MLEEVLVLSVPYAAAIVAALILPGLGLLQYRWAGRWPDDLRVACLLVLLSAGALLSVAFVPRVLNERLFKPEFVYASDAAAGFLASRIFSALIVGAALVELVRGWREAARSGWRDPAAMMVWAILGFFFGTLLVQAVASEHPGFSFRSLYVPVVVLAVCLLQVQRVDRILVAAKWCLLTCTLGSLLMVLVRPDFALATPYNEGFLPGIKFRLVGLATHANALGPVAVLALLLELHTPSERRVVRWLHLSTAVTVLLLAQSKTAWVAAMLIPLVTWVPLNVLPAQQPRLERRSFSRATLILTAGLLLLASLAVLLAQIDLVDFFRRNGSLLTLTGRLGIWDMTLEEWRKNIFFGYGPELWGPAYRRQLNMMHAGHAHNQFIQTLGDSGLFGLAALVAFLGALLLAAWRSFRASRGLVMGLFVLFLVRCMTEASMRTESLLSWTNFTNILTLALACQYLRHGSRATLSATSERSPGWQLSAGT